MDRETVYQKLTTLFQDVFDDDEVILQDRTTAQDIEGWDSLTHVNLMVSAEQAFGIKFKTSEMAQLTNVGELVNVITHKLVNR
jgi:acyl carrier protein